MDWNQERILAELNQKAIALKTPKDLSPLIDRLSQARVVLLGESSHGTREFYEWRRMISEWLIVKHGFNIIAVEGDWPPCQNLNRYIQTGEGGSARNALEWFQRWPTWMWANTEIVRFAEWLREQNVRRGADIGRSPVTPIASQIAEGGSIPLIGFHGLDVYSLFESIEVVIEKLNKINPFLARQAKNRYACFSPYQNDERAYVRSLIQFPEGCEEEVVMTLQDLLKTRLTEYSEENEATLFDAQQNARVIHNAEKYYRSMIQADENSWNIRDRHMLETLETLLARYGSDSRAIVWAHNSHVGDYRATDMARSGLVNLGGLSRLRFGKENVAILGFGTHHGKVVASHAWDGPTTPIQIPPGHTGSYEDLLHQHSVASRQKQFFLLLDRGVSETEGPIEKSALTTVLGHRAIGVVYDPEHERWGNYVPTSLAERYDAFLFIDETDALEPLILGFEEKKLPETWPTGQ